MNTPEELVQRQLDAYNARDIDALLAVYSDDAELYEHPATLVARGAEALRERFKVRFEEPNLYARLLKRIVIGTRVIDHEEVSRTFFDGTGKIELVMIYELQDQRIARAWSIIGPKSLDPK